MWAGYSLCPRVWVPERPSRLDCSLFPFACSWWHLPPPLGSVPSWCHGAAGRRPACCAPQVFGFFATIVFAIDFYLIFNDVARFLKQGDSADESTAHKAEGEGG